MTARKQFIQVHHKRAVNYRERVVGLEGVELVDVKQLEEAETMGGDGVCAKDGIFNGGEDGAGLGVGGGGDDSGKAVLCDLVNINIGLHGVRKFVTDVCGLVVDEAGMQEKRRR